MNRITIFLLFALLGACGKGEQPGPDTSIPTRDANLAFGNPSGANSSQENNYFIDANSESLKGNKSVTSIFLPCR